MTAALSRRQAISLMAIGGLVPAIRCATAAPTPEIEDRSAKPGYDLQFSSLPDELVGDILNTERGDPHRESATPHHEWYSEHVRRRLGAWGPMPRLYPPLAGLDSRPLEWQRERVVATAARFIGYGYQHHHIPDWDPPHGWPWKHSCVGHNGKGFDCSNFTSFVYNQGFGIRISSGIQRQARIEHAFEAGHPLRIARVDLPAGYKARHDVMRTGDLLYIRGREDGPITHVVIWIGPIGRASSGAPLIMDSHGAGVTDDKGSPIPCGVQLRPFREDSWYNRCASHAHRFLHERHA
jgi:cell wall-associated NlpC family hydrolase